jgi:hypothetical protein
MLSRAGLLLLAGFLFGTTPGRTQDRVSRVQVAAGAGYLATGKYFSGPSSTSLTNGDAAGVMLQVGVRVQRSFDVVVAGSYAQPEWRLEGLPLVGSLTLPGAQLWFGDVELRGRLPLEQSTQPVSLFAQAGPGLVRYSVSTSFLGNRIEASATNFAIVVGAGIQAPLARRFGLELLAKDYIASFKSVRDLEAFGVEGRRAHTLMIAASVRLEL